MAKRIKIFLLMITLLVIVSNITIASTNFNQVYDQFKSIYGVSKVKQLSADIFQYTATGNFDKYKEYNITKQEWIYNKTSKVVKLKNVVKKELRLEKKYLTRTMIIEIKDKSFKTYISNEVVK